MRQVSRACAAGAGPRSVRRVSDERIAQLRLRIGQAAGLFAVTGAGFYRDNLRRAMRRAIAAGLPQDEVIALSVLPRDEAELLLSGR